LSVVIIINFNGGVRPPFFEEKIMNTYDYIIKEKEEKITQQVQNMLDGNTQYLIGWIEKYENDENIKFYIDSELNFKFVVEHSRHLGKQHFRNQQEAVNWFVAHTDCCDVYDMNGSAEILY
jgi:hypothetical protein